MDIKTYRSLKKSISDERLAVYKADGADEKTAIARYIYNIELCKSFYLLINIFEVTLRNSMDNALVDFFNNADWNNVIPLLSTGLSMISDANLKIKRNGKKYSHGRLVAELTLGFWVALMGRKYNNQSFQYAIIKKCLHKCPARRILLPFKKISPKSAICGTELPITNALPIGKILSKNMIC